MKRVVIIGCPGSGKTTFSRKLAVKTKLPEINLDYYYNQTKYDYSNNTGAWVAKVKRLIKQDLWIMDGNYNSTIAERFKRADTIIFFDLPRYKSLFGVIKRRIQYRNKRRLDMPSDWVEKVSFKFLIYVWWFRRDSRDAILKAIEENVHKDIVIFTNRKQAQKFLNG